MKNFFVNAVYSSRCGNYVCISRAGDKITFANFDTAKAFTADILIDTDTGEEFIRYYGLQIRAKDFVEMVCPHTSDFADFLKAALVSAVQNRIEAAIGMFILHFMCFAWGAGALLMVDNPLYGSALMLFPMLAFAIIQPYAESMANFIVKKLFVQ